MKLKIFLAFFIFFAFPAVSAAEDEVQQLRKQIENQEEELSRTEDQIRQLRSRLRMLSEKEKELTAELDKIEKDIESRQKKLNRVHSDIQQVNRQIAAAEEEIRRKQRKKTGHETELKKLARAYYYKFNRSSPSWITCLLDSGKKNTYLLAGMMRAPAEACIFTEEEIERIIGETEELRHKNRQLTQLKEQVVSLQNELIDKRKDQMDILHKIHSQQEERQARIDEKKKERQQLEKLLKSLRYKARSLKRLSELAEGFAQSKGNLPWPVRGKVVSRFGRQRHPSLDTYIYNRGIEMEVSPPAAVSAVAGGEVVFADTFRAKGQMVVIDHGNNYYTIYGGLKNMSVQGGAMLEAMDTVGESSSNFYFELGRGSDPQDPLQWLE